MFEVGADAVGPVDAAVGPVDDAVGPVDGAAGTPVVAGTAGVELGLAAGLEAGAGAGAAPCVETGVADVGVTLSDDGVELAVSVATGALLTFGAGSTDDTGALGATDELGATLSAAASAR